MPAHITILPIAGTVTVAAGSTVLGTSQRALELREGHFAPVTYVPREDIDMGRLVATRHKTNSPWKGRRAITRSRAGSACWPTQPGPMRSVAEVQAIAGYLAFHVDRVTITRD